MTARPSSPGSSELPDRIVKLLDSGRLKQQDMTLESVAALWQKAVSSARDAELHGMSVDGALRSAYDAGLGAALALLAAHGLRTASGQGHHEVVFAAAAALGGEDLADLIPDSMEVRGLRKGSMYDPVIAGPEERDQAIEWVRRTLPVVRRAIVDRTPGMADRIENYPPRAKG